MMSNTSIRRRTPAMPMSVPSSTSSLLNHMMQITGDDATVADIKDDDKNLDGNDDDDPLSDNSDDDDILRTLIHSSLPSSSIITSNKLKSNLSSKPILIEPSSSSRRQSNVPLSFGLRSILTRSFCRRRREST